METTTITAPKHEANRLTENDRERIIARIVETIDGWTFGQPTRTSRYIVKDSDHETLLRIGLCAIGCGPDDMRDSELEEVETMVRIAATDISRLK